jgi:hypothetical protein
MTAPDLEKLLSVITAALGGFPRMRRAADVAEFTTQTSIDARRFVVRKPERPLRIRVAEQLDLEMDAIVCDGELGSVGLIHVVPAEAIEDWMRRRIGEGVYFRQLLLDQVGRSVDNSGKLAYAIELVFLVEENADSKGHEFAVQLGQVLRTIVREAGFLYAVGINVWRALDGASLADPGPVRRAFAWLLKDTEEWYRGALNGGLRRHSHLGPLVRVELDNFRIAGKRAWILSDGPALHLVHGHNGSGKSSLCEALEVVLTGTIERLRGADHFRVVTNRASQPAGNAATVTLEVEGGKPLTWAVRSDGVDGPLQLGLPGASFRMDQGLADRLSHTDAAGRARLFLEAFFPEQREEVAKRDEAERSLHVIFDKLPKRLRSNYSDSTGKPDLAKIRDSLGWVKSSPFSWANVLALLPLTAEQITPLGPLLPREFVEVFQRTSDAEAAYVESATTILKKGLTDIVAGLEKHLQSLDQAIAVLQEYGNTAVALLPPETEELGFLMNEWLALVALTDILDREDELVAALSVAHSKGYAFTTESKPLLVGADISRRSERLEILQVLKTKRDDFRRRIMRHGTSTGFESADSKQLRPLNEFRLESLDTVAALGIFGNHWRGVSLARAVREAFGDRRVVQVRLADSALAPIGDQNWGGGLLANAAKVRDALQSITKLQADIQDAIDSLDKLWTWLQQLHEAATNLTKIDTKLLNTFALQVGDGGPLSRAVNELMALLTPARWGYEDIVTRAEFTSGTTTLELQTADAVPMKLRLNTAELNTFAITLFLLCARRIYNVLRIIVLDDPLQNMDELTVVAVARGLGRLLRVWKRLDTDGPPWRLLILLHSEEDIACFRSEIPCVTYLLPWLSPQGTLAKSTPHTRVIPSLLRQQLQPLETVLSMPPHPVPTENSA